MEISNRKKNGGSSGNQNETDNKDNNRDCLVFNSISNIKEGVLNGG
jgi:hypothetical protein